MISEKLIADSLEGMVTFFFYNKVVHLRGRGERGCMLSVGLSFVAREVIMKM